MELGRIGLEEMSILKKRCEVSLESIGRKEKTSNTIYRDTISNHRVEKCTKAITRNI